MDYMKLADKTQITIEDGASLDRIVHVAENEADAQAACMAVRAAGNLDHVEFFNEGAEEPYGSYERCSGGDYLPAGKDGHRKASGCP